MLPLLRVLLVLRGVGAVGPAIGAGVVLLWFVTGAFVIYFMIPLIETIL